VASADRTREVAELLGRATAWAAGRADVAAVALVGSWARHEARQSSDVDLVVLTDDPAAYTEHTDWVEELVPGARLVRTEDWGPIVERRLRLPSGVELEVGLGPPSWAVTTPVDPGTRRVVDDGLSALHDPRGLLAALAIACRSAPREAPAPCGERRRDV
jgi:predicted nucleotidyltransferase